MQIFLNDKLVPESDARVSVLDRGFLYGDSVFETLRAYGGEPFMLSAHLRRLERSADALGIHIPISIDELRSALMSTLEANSLKNAYLRVMVTRGVGAPGFDPTADTTPTLVVLARELVPYPEDMYTEGVRLVVSSVRRNHPQALDPSIKSGNFLNNILAKADASRAGAYDSVMLSLQGFVAECTSSNIFFARDGVLYTPSTGVGILDGITRGTVIKLAQERDIQVQEGKFALESLMEADEVFITNTTMEVMPVRAVDDRTFRPGPLAKRLREAYQALIKQKNI